MLPIVVPTFSIEERDLSECYELGCNGYVRKPVDFDRFIDAARRLELHWPLINEPPPG